MSYVYSTIPLPPVDTLNNHDGFWFLFWFLLIVLIVVCASVMSNVIRLGATIAYAVTMMIAGTVSWTTGDIRYYENRPVEATLVGFQAEGFKETSGKRYVDVHYTYVTYKVPGEGIVILRSYPNQAYPDKAILYANKAAQQ